MAYQSQNEFYQNDWNQGWGYDMSSGAAGDSDQGGGSYPDNNGFIPDHQGGFVQQQQQFGQFDYSSASSSAYDFNAYGSQQDAGPVYSLAGQTSSAPVDLGSDYSSSFMPPPTSAPYTGSIFQPALPSQGGGFQRQRSAGPHSAFDEGLGSAGHAGGVGGEDFEDEPPLLEELGINFDHILQKTWSVLHLLKETDPQVVGDSDMAGPLVFCFALMATLLLGGKVAFGYIYGLGLMGCLGMYFLLNLMSVSGVALSCVVSILGYCLLPMVLLSFLSLLLSLQGPLGVFFASLSILWCGLAAAKLFVGALDMRHQRLIVMYPCCLVYGVFALLTVF